jgi:membrane protein implicated in regulation of membrane protease activity
MRVRRWEMPEEPLPKHPFRNSAIFHFVLACLLVLVAWITGGGIPRALAFAIGYFVIATGYSWWRWRQRVAEEQQRREQRARRPATRREGR